MKKSKKIILKTCIALAIVFVLIIGGFFFFRDAVLAQVIQKTSNKLKQDYNSSLTIQKAAFVGLSGLEITDMTLVPKDADTLFRIQKMETSVNFWHLFIGDIQLGTLKINNGLVQLVQKGKVKNFAAFLLKRLE